MSQATRIESGSNVSITAENPLLKELVVGFGWNIITSHGPDVELVPSAIMCNKDGVAISDDHMIFFNQLATSDGSVQYVSGDDTEQLDINLSLVPEAVEKIVFIVYVDPDIRKPGTFGSVRNPYIHVADRENNDIVRFDLGQVDMNVTAMIFGELYRYKGQWKFRAIGQGYPTGLAGVAKDYKVAL